ncbi:MAG: rhomboid family intramembrane serine protease [Bacteroidota bacterium]
MSLSDYYQEKLSLGDRKNALTRLIAIHLIVFITLVMARTYFYFTRPDEAKALGDFTRQFFTWFGLPNTWQAWLHKPWTLLTAPFSHLSVWTTFGNMLWLWIFGYILQDLSGNRKIIPLFIYGGVFGCISFLLVPGSSDYYFGATAGVGAIAVATTFISPYYRIFPLLSGGIPLWGLTLFYILSALSTLNSYTLAGVLPQVSGLIAGAIYYLVLREGIDLTDWMSRLFDWCNDLFDPEKQTRQPQKGKLFYMSNHPPYKKTAHLTQERIDAILDKIGKDGMESLTEEEKIILKRSRNELD